MSRILLLFIFNSCNICVVKSAWPLCGSCDLLSHHLPDFDGKKVFDFPLATFHGLQFLLDCIRRCWDNNKCRSYMFNRGSGLCSTFAVGYSDVTNTFTPISDESGANLYTACGRTSVFGTRCTLDIHCHYTNAMCSNQRCICALGFAFDPSSGDCQVGTNEFGTICIPDTDCQYTLSSCNSNTCGCAEGYSFDPSTGTCITRCQVYGDFAIVIIGKAIDGHNEIGTKAASPLECIEKCLAETSFTCVSIDYEYSTDTCNLQAKAWHDVGVSHNTVEGWEFHQRHCQV